MTCCSSESRWSRLPKESGKNAAPPVWAASAFMAPSAIRAPAPLRPKTPASSRCTPQPGCAPRSQSPASESPSSPSLSEANFTASQSQVHPLGVRRKRREQEGASRQQRTRGQTSACFQRNHNIGASGGPARHYSLIWIFQNNNFLPYQNQCGPECAGIPQKLVITYPLAVPPAALIQSRLPFRLSNRIKEK